MCGVARDQDESLEEGSRTIQLMQDMVSEPVVKPHGGDFCAFSRAFSAFLSLFYPTTYFNNTF